MWYIKHLQHQLAHFCWYQLATNWKDKNACRRISLPCPPASSFPPRVGKGTAGWDVEHEESQAWTENASSDKSNLLIAHLQLRIAIVCTSIHGSIRLLKHCCIQDANRIHIKLAKGAQQVVVKRCWWLLYLESIVNTIRIIKGFKEVWGFMKFTTRFYATVLSGWCSDPPPLPSAPGIEIIWKLVAWKVCHSREMLRHVAALRNQQNSST